MLASELFAIAHNTVCSGEELCHWCAAPCKRIWMHDDPPPIPFQRSTSTAKQLASLYICIGCWLYRRKRTTIRFLAGGFKDGQDLSNHSWWLTKDQCLTLQSADNETLYAMLLSPPNAFALSLLDGKCSNLLQLAVTNNISIIQGDTQLNFTVNNIRCSYTVYELESAIAHSNSGRSPGIQTLFNLFSPPSTKMKSNKSGRPPNEDKLPKTIVNMSGSRS